MSHKVHPKVFRLKKTADWSSRWFNKKKFSEYLEEDFKIRKFLEKRLKDCSVEIVEIERFSGKISVIINTARPGFVIGRGGKGVEEIKKDLEILLFSGIFKKEKKVIRLEIKEIRDPWSRANLVMQWIAQQLERRVHFRRVLKQALDKIMVVKDIKGARVEVSGRLGGAEIARREWLQKGKLPRQNLRADIDYGEGQAHCTYGVIGIKVWIYKGEKF